MSNRAKTLLLLIVDILILFVALSLVVYSRKENLNAATFLNQHYALFAFIFPFWILMYFIEGVYTLRTYNPANLSISILRSTFLSVFVSFIIFYFIPFVNIIIIFILLCYIEEFLINNSFKNVFLDNSSLLVNPYFTVFTNPI